MSRVEISSDCLKSNINSLIGTLGLVQKEEIRDSTYEPNKVIMIIGVSFLFLGLSIILIMVAKGVIEYTKNRLIAKTNNLKLNKNESIIKENSLIKSICDKDRQNTINTDISSFTVNSLNSEKLINKTLNTTIETSNWTTNSKLPTICSEFVLTSKEKL